MADEEKVCKAEVDVNAVKEAEAAVKEMKTWITVFAKEYDIAEEAVNVLTKKVEELANKIGAITCKIVE